MYIIAGLGNPEPRYRGTRHNTGFEVIDLLSEKYGIHLDQEKHRAMCGRGLIEGERVLLAKPLTYMNLSGESIAEIVSYYKADPNNDLIVISDDIDLDVGKIRIRPKGSAGGHNGLKNIISLLKTDGFTRLRIGVGAKPKDWDLVDWVLGHFCGDDVAIMETARQRAAEAAVRIISTNVETAMNDFNAK